MFESTSFIVGTGRELFITTHSPNGSFDRISDNINKPMLLLIFGGLVIAVLMVGRIADAKLPVKRFLAFLN